MSKSLNIKEILERTIKHFEKYGIQNPRLDAEVLLADLLGLERIQLYVRFDQPLTKSEIDKYRERVILRSKRVPVQYIVGHQEFMSLDFKVNKNVLIPRPETEHLVQAVIKFLNEAKFKDPLIVDVGTGSGAIAISLAHNLPEARVIGIDIFPQALEVAKENGKRHRVEKRVKFIKGSFLDPIIKANLHPQVIVSNPPYIKRSDLKNLQPEVKFEPRVALDGGEDGLDAYRQIISGAEVLSSGGLLAFEVGIGQSEEVATMMEKSFDKITVLKDLAGIDRVVMGIKK
ncbi:protein-(glutamine-N5) methyltransferase, release factor-specific [Anoxybacter fermentans]|uniref:Release factor glutamine methyltransferase n=1 Tax=Anoxybacter fermentans TaxID=1323375 RepID=A0A3S9T081_9FIRM|nr:peptide chain release factor N(5)-glutamine methyltransferase [Anoxybacter fermentans]AZR74013.1 protein-(glutamine-N5) methyltransferase, release factor-specific [Anoxybacter fermentans]